MIVARCGAVTCAPCCGIEDRRSAPRPWSLGLFLAEARSRRAASTSWPASGDRVVGFAGLLLRRSTTATSPPSPSTPTTRAAASAPACCSSLVRRAIERGAEAHHPRGAGVATRPPRRLYRRFGFVPAGVRKGYYRRPGRGRPRACGPTTSTCPPTPSASASSRPSSDTARGRGARPAAAPPRGARRARNARGGYREPNPDPRHRDLVRRDGGGGGRRRHEVLSSVVSSQVDLHARFGGVVPEIASRAHVELLTPGDRPGAGRGRRRRRPTSTPSPPPSGPGLVGALLVGVSAAKALALVWDVPFVAVNHLEAHLYAALLEEPDLELPARRAARLGRPHPAGADGGPRPVPGARLDHRRRRGRGLRQGRPLPRPRLPGRPGDRPARHGGRPRRPSRSPGRCWTTGYDFSFSRAEDRGRQPRAQAPRRRHRGRRRLVPGGRRRRAGHQGPARRPATTGAKGLCLGGGVAANSQLRERLLDACVADGLRGVPAQPLDVHRQRRHGGRRRLVPAGSPTARRRSTPAPTRTCASRLAAEPTASGVAGLPPPGRPRARLRIVSTRRMRVLSTRTSRAADRQLDTANGGARHEPAAARRPHRRPARSRPRRPPPAAWSSPTPPRRSPSRARSSPSAPAVAREHDRRAHPRRRQGRRHRRLLASTAAPRSPSTVRTSSSSTPATSSPIVK